MTTENQSELEKEAKELARKHWQFLGRWLHMMFVDGFIHGYKHGVESKQYKLKEKR